MTNSVTQEYLDDFRDQDARTPSDFVNIKARIITKGMRDVTFDIEAAAIRDFDTYITNSNAMLLPREQADVVEDWLKSMLELEEEGLMDDLDFHDEDGRTEEILKNINVIRAVLGLKPKYIHRDYPYAATWQMPDGRWGWAEPRHTLREVGDEIDPQRLSQKFLELFGEKTKTYTFVEGPMPNE